MSEKEKRIAEGITKLPDPLKDRFLDQIQGAVLALDMMGASPPAEKGGQQDGERAGRKGQKEHCAVESL